MKLTSDFEEALYKIINDQYQSGRIDNSPIEMGVEIYEEFVDYCCEKMKVKHNPYSTYCFQHIPVVCNILLPPRMVYRPMIPYLKSVPK